MQQFDVYATRNARPSKPGDRVTLQLVAAGVQTDVEDSTAGADAISTALKQADLAALHLGGLVAIPTYGYTHKVVAVDLTDPPEGS